MAQHSFVVEGDVNVLVTLTELPDGTIRFDIQVIDTDGQTGDLRGLFFDFGDNATVADLSVDGDDVTASVFNADSVTKTAKDNTLSGEVVNEAGKFDVGIEFGTSGMATDDIQSTSFILSSASGPLTLDDLALQDFGVRLTSVGDIDGSRNDSLKLLGTSGEVSGEFEPEILAVTDYLVVYESDTFPDPDTTTGGSASVLDNDTVDGVAYDGPVYDDAGNQITDYAVLLGDNGGVMILYADGSMDFDNNGDFEALEDGQSSLTTFTYGIDGGATGNIVVEVLGESGGDGGGDVITFL